MKLPGTRIGRVALAVLAIGAVAALAATWFGALFRLAAVVILDGLAAAVLAVRSGERSLWLLVPAALVFALAFGFIIGEWSG